MKIQKTKREIIEEIIKIMNKSVDRLEYENLRRRLFQMKKRDLHLLLHLLKIK